MVPQLIPRDPVNIDGVKAGFASVRSNILHLHPTHPDIGIDPTNDAPIAVFDGNVTLTASSMLNGLGCFSSV
jgi:hypothetical protein